jgi:hypothetical protein
VRRTTVLTVLALLALAGCSTEVRGSAAPASGVVAPPPAEGGATGDGAPAEDGGASGGAAGDLSGGAEGGAEGGAAGGAVSGDAAFGDALEYDDGLVVTVGAPQDYTPSDTAYVDGPVPAAYVAFDVTIVTGTGQDFEPIGFLLTLQSGSTEESQVFDSVQGLDGTPYTTLLPGREVSFRVGFGASVPDDLVLEVTPGFDYEPVVYTS